MSRNLPKQKTNVNIKKDHYKNDNNKISTFPPSSGLAAESGRIIGDRTEARVSGQPTDTKPGPHQAVRAEMRSEGRMDTQGFEREVVFQSPGFMAEAGKVAVVEFGPGKRVQAREEHHFPKTITVAGDETGAKQFLNDALGPAAPLILEDAPVVTFHFKDNRLVGAAILTGSEKHLWVPMIPHSEPYEPFRLDDRQEVPPLLYTSASISLEKKNMRIQYLPRIENYRFSQKDATRKEVLRWQISLNHLGAFLSKKKGEPEELRIWLGDREFDVQDGQNPAEIRPHVGEPEERKLHRGQGILSGLLGDILSRLQQPVKDIRRNVSDWSEFPDWLIMTAEMEFMKGQNEIRLRFEIPGGVPVSYKVAEYRLKLEVKKGHGRTETTFNIYREGIEVTDKHEKDFVFGLVRYALIDEANRNNPDFLKTPPVALSKKNTVRELGRRLRSEMRYDDDDDGLTIEIYGFPDSYEIRRLSLNETFGHRRVSGESGIDFRELLKNRFDVKRNQPIRFLDLGTGSGSFLKNFSEYLRGLGYPNVEGIGVEKNPKPVSSDPSLILGKNYIVADVSELTDKAPQLQPESFQLIAMQAPQLIHNGVTTPSRIMLIPGDFKKWLAAAKTYLAQNGFIFIRLFHDRTEESSEVGSTWMKLEGVLLKRALDADPDLTYREFTFETTPELVSGKDPVGPLILVERRAEMRPPDKAIARSYRAHRQLTAAGDIRGDRQRRQRQEEVDPSLVSPLKDWISERLNQLVAFVPEFQNTAQGRHWRVPEAKTGAWPVGKALDPAKRYQQSLPNALDYVTLIAERYKGKQPPFPAIDFVFDIENGVVKLKLMNPHTGEPYKKDDILQMVNILNPSDEFEAFIAALRNGTSLDEIYKAAPPAEGRRPEVKEEIADTGEFSFPPHMLRIEKLKQLAMEGEMTAELASLRVQVLSDLENPAIRKEVQAHYRETIDRLKKRGLGEEAGWVGNIIGGLLKESARIVREKSEPAEVPLPTPEELEARADQKSDLVKSLKSGSYRQEIRGDSIAAAVRYINRFFELQEQGARFDDRTGNEPFDLRVPKNRQGEVKDVLFGKRTILSTDFDDYNAYETEVPVFIETNDREDIVGVAISLNPQSSKLVRIQVLRKSGDEEKPVDPSKLERPILGPDGQPLTPRNLFLRATMITGDELGRLRTERAENRTEGENREMEAAFEELPSRIDALLADARQSFPPGMKDVLAYYDHRYLGSVPEETETGLGQRVAERIERKEGKPPESTHFKLEVQSGVIRIERVLPKENKERSELRKSAAQSIKAYNLNLVELLSTTAHRIAFIAKGMLAPRIAEAAVINFANDVLKAQNGGAWTQTDVMTAAHPVFGASLAPALVVVATGEVPSEEAMQTDVDLLANSGSDQGVIYVVSLEKDLSAEEKQKLSDFVETLQEKTDAEGKVIGQRFGVIVTKPDYAPVALNKALDTLAGAVRRNVIGGASPNVFKQEHGVLILEDNLRLRLDSDRMTGILLKSGAFNGETASLRNAIGRRFAQHEGDVAIKAELLNKELNTQVIDAEKSEILTGGLLQAVVQEIWRAIKGVLKARTSA